MHPNGRDIIFHIAGWLLFVSLIFGFLAEGPGGGNVLSIFTTNCLIFFAVYFFVFYFNSEFLIPKLYLQKKYLYYFSIVIAMLIAVFFIKPFDNLLLHGPGGPGGPDGPGVPPAGRRGPPLIDITSIVLFVMAISLSSAIQIIKQWQNILQRASRAEADKAQAELSFLKAQINPHFLFNTLNNIYALSVTNNENTSVSIMKLSNIMRYVTDEATEDFVSLESEVECINDYIDLQRIRLNKNVYVNFSVSGELEHKRIAPLILMSFIENVFKYGVSSHEPATITIKIFAEEKTITFYCQNNLFTTQRRQERTGIGIANTKQRLQYLYPDKHFLNITSENGHFTVQLTLQL